MSKEDILVRLKKAIPHLKMRREGYFLEEFDYVSPADLDWADVLDLLEKQGLRVVDVSDKAVTNKRVTNPDYDNLLMEMDCDHCGKETMSTITGRHERDSTYEMITCTECGWFSIGGNEQEDPDKYKNS